MLRARYPKISDMSAVHSTTANNQSAKRFITRPEAAEMLGLSVRTLDKWALFGTGPRFRKIGNRACRYDLADLEAFISDRKSTRLNSSHLGISYAVFCLKKT